MIDLPELQQKRQQRTQLAEMLDCYREGKVRSVAGELAKLIDRTEFEISALENQLMNLDEEIAILEGFEDK